MYVSNGHRFGLGKLRNREKWIRQLFPNSFFSPSIYLEVERREEERVAHSGVTTSVPEDGDSHMISLQGA